MIEEATELEWLEWFFYNADFGPADTDVRIIMEERFEAEIGKLVPLNWSSKED